MGLRQLIFRSSESDRDERIGEDDERQKENRKWSVKSKLPIKDERKSKQVKENNRNDLQVVKNRFLNFGNQSNNHLFERNEDADQSEHIDKQSDKILANRLDKVSLEGEFGVQQIDCEATKNIIPIVDDCENQQQQVNQATTTQISDEQNERNKNQQVKKHSFTPKSLQIIKKAFLKKESSSNDEFDDQRKNGSNGRRKLSMNEMTISPLNSPKNVTISPLNSSKSGTNQVDVTNSNEKLSETKRTRNNRRRKQNQSFDNLSDRLQYIQSLSGNKIHKRYENEELRSTHFKSEDHLLDKIPLPPRATNSLNSNSLNTTNQIERQILQEFEENEHSRLRNELNSESNFYSRNPIYESFDRLIQMKPIYVNVPVFQESNSRPRACDLELLRQLKPERFPLKVSNDCETIDLKYVNLIFENENNELKVDNDDRLMNDKLSKKSTSTSSSSYSTDSSGVNHILSNHVDLTKSIDLKLFDLNNSSYLLSKRESKSDDESCSKTQYSQIDWIKTDGLLTIREARKNHHL